MTRAQLVTRIQQRAESVFCEEFEDPLQVSGANAPVDSDFSRDIDPARSISPRRPGPFDLRVEITQNRANSTRDALYGLSAR